MVRDGETIPERKQSSELESYQSRLRGYYHVINDGYYAGTGQRGQNDADARMLKLLDLYNALPDDAKLKTSPPARANIMDDGTGGIATGLGVMARAAYGV